MSLNNTGKSYEELIYKIYKALEPHADVRLNDKILGISNIKRQIDVSIRAKIADHELLIIVQAKDHKKPADIRILGEFDYVLRDVGASKGILICSGGFAKSILKEAKRLKIDLCSALDASNKNWSGIIQIPVIRRVVDIVFEIEFEFKINQELIQASNGHIHIDAQKAKNLKMPNGYIIRVIEEFKKAWDIDAINKDIGKYIFSLFEAGMQIELMPNIYVELKSLDIFYTVNKSNYFKFISPTNYCGISNYINDTFKAVSISYQDVIPSLNDGTWQHIENPDTISVKSTLINIEQFNFGEERLLKMSLM